LYPPFSLFDLTLGGGKLASCCSFTQARTSPSRLFSMIAVCDTRWSLSNTLNGKESLFHNTSKRPSAN
jgi:hypothetical protein